MLTSGQRTHFMQHSAKLELLFDFDGFSQRGAADHLPSFQFVMDLFAYACVRKLNDFSNLIAHTKCGLLVDVKS
jgi:hypothetical protein